jgi:hypothetical protein
LVALERKRLIEAEKERYALEAAEKVEALKKQKEAENEQEERRMRDQ